MEDYLQKVGMPANTLSIDQKILESIRAYYANFESAQTSRTYQAVAREFFSLVSSKIEHLGELHRNHVIAYAAWLRENGKSRNTINSKLSAISSLCKHLAYEGIVDRDLTYGVKRPKQTNVKETADFEDAQIKQIFNSLNPKRKFFTSHRAILAIGFYTGLRSLEIRTLKVKYLAEVAGHRVLKLIIKGNKPHEVPLTPFCYHAITEHLQFLKKRYDVDISDGEQWIFPTLGPVFKNQPISKSGLNVVLNTKLKQAGIPISSARRYSPHSMRATVASHLLNEKNVPLEDVQRLLGHSSPQTTQKYNKRIKDHDKSPVYKIDY